MPVTTDDVKGTVAGALKLPGPASLQSWWDEHISNGLADGLADVRSILAARGFSQEQLDGWPGYDSFVRRQSAFWALVYGGVMEAFDMKSVEKLDLREALKTVVVTGADGLAVKAGVVGRGELGSKGESTFVDADGRFRRW